MKMTKKQIKAAAVKYSKKQHGKLYADNPDVVGSIVEDFIAGAIWMDREHKQWALKLIGMADKAKKLIKKIEATEFECHAGPLANCVSFKELKQLLS